MPLVSSCTRRSTLGILDRQLLRVLNLFVALPTICVPDAMASSLLRLHPCRRHSPHCPLLWPPPCCSTLLVQTGPGRVHFPFSFTSLSSVFQLLHLILSPVCLCILSIRACCFYLLGYVRTHRTCPFLLVLCAVRSRQLLLMLQTCHQVFCCVMCPSCHNTNNHCVVCTSSSPHVLPVFNTMP